MHFCSLLQHYCELNSCFQITYALAKNLNEQALTAQSLNKMWMILMLLQIDVP